MSPQEQAWLDTVNRVPSTVQMTEEGPAGLDLHSLSGYLGVPVSATLIPGGRSNLTYHVVAGGDDLVLRRPPLCR